MPKIVGGNLTIERQIIAKHKGAWAELVACQWLLSQGYEVYRNVSAHGIADLIATRDNEVLKVDVKSSKKGLKINQIGVVLLRVFQDGTCRFDNPPICVGCGQKYILGRRRWNVHLCKECNRSERRSEAQAARLLPQSEVDCRQMSFA